MRIASLLPAATEMVAALGAANELVGVSHECDYPDAVTGLRKLTTSPIDISQPGAAIDAQVRALHAAGRPVIAVDGSALVAARPELLLTQGLCEVCAVVEGDVRTLAETVSPSPTVVPLSARTLPGILTDIMVVGAAIGRAAEARDVIAALQHRLHALAAGRPGVAPRVAVVEWLEPLYLAGHWVPEMVEAAGGINVGAAPGDHSYARRWCEVVALEPDLIVIALCGLSLDRATSEWHRFVAQPSDQAAEARRLAVPVWAIDGNAYTSRPGPRTVDGAELLQRAFAGTEGPGVVKLCGPGLRC